MSFYRSSCEERLQVGYPPHKRLVNIILSGEDLQKVKVASSQLAVLLRDKNQEMQLLGPANCPLERLQGKWRRHILLKLAPQVSVEWLGQAMRTFDPQGVEWIVDVDPYTLM
jgi:primosomal protein N' (replication factor Y)